MITHIYTDASAHHLAVTASSSKQTTHKRAKGRKHSPKTQSKNATSYEDKVDPNPTITVSYVPQNPHLLGVKQAELEGKVSDGPTGPRFKVSEPRNFPRAKANQNGNFIYRPDDPRFDAVNSYYIASKTLAMAEKYLGRELPWSFTEELGREQMIIHPHAGEMANAFYSADTGSINFFHYKDADGVIHRTASQSDVVAHETGHAILDAIRPTYIHSLSVAAGGFHESFGDMVAILNALNDEAVVDRMWRDTKGDLSKSNVVSQLAEDLGGRRGALRDAVNRLKYADQHFLPYIDLDNPNQGFGQEAHAYSNLFTGAFYDLFTALYTLASDNGDRSFKEAVADARDLAGKLLFRAMEFAPVGDPSYREIALAFLKADQIDNNGLLKPLISAVFENRGILNEQDIEQFDKSEAELPKLRFRRKLMTADGAIEYLREHEKKLGVDAGRYQFLKAYSNDQGERHILYTTHRDTTLDDPDFGTQEGAKLRAYGGLHLAFDKSGKLIAADKDEITDRELQDMKDHLRAAMSIGRVATQNKPDSIDLNEPMLMIDVVSDGNNRIVQRSSIIYG